MASWFQSPLVGTALVGAAMIAISVPLAHLTAEQDPVAPTATPTEAAAADRFSGFLRIRTLVPVPLLEIATSRGEVIARMESVAPGEHEVDAEFPWDSHRVVLRLTAEVGDTDTAVFLNVLPDGYEERTAYAIGSGRIEEELALEWPHP